LKLVKDHAFYGNRIDISCIKKSLQIVLNDIPWLAFSHAILLLVQAIIWYLISTEVLALGYGWDGRMQEYAFTSVLGTQIIFAFIIQRVQQPMQQKSLYQAQYVLTALISFWLYSCLEIHYKWL